MQKGCPSFLHTIKYMSAVAMFYSFIALGHYVLYVHDSIQDRT